MQKDILKIVQQTFEANPEIEIFHVTSDGQCFHKRNEASIHARALKDDSIVPVTRGMVEKQLSGSEVEKATGDRKLSVEERLEKVASASTVEELESLLNGETAKTVKSAIDDKIEEMNRQTVIETIKSADSVEAVEKLLEGHDGDDLILAAGDARKKEFE